MGRAFQEINYFKDPEGISFKSFCRYLIEMQYFLSHHETAQLFAQMDRDRDQFIGQEEFFLSMGKVMQPQHAERPLSASRKSNPKLLGDKLVDDPKLASQQQFYSSLRTDIRRDHEAVRHFVTFFDENFNLFSEFGKQVRKGDQEKTGFIELDYFLYLFGEMCNDFKESEEA